MNELALFAGAGGGILGGKLLGWRTICAVEINPYARSVLLARQRDGILDPFPIWDDITTFDGRKWNGSVDVISGGFPCQDISTAGSGKGIAGERSGLWSQMGRIICEVQPKYILVENSPMLVSKGLDIVLADLAQMGFDAEWGIISAENTKASHQRKRIWIVAYSKMLDETWGYTEKDRRATEQCYKHRRSVWGGARPKPCRMDDGLAFGVDRLHAIGNGQVPEVVTFAWKLLTSRLSGRKKLRHSA
jgi:DNA (cytosine-5)-methyltransferase 1